MAADRTGDLGVDVLIVGAGLQALYLAGALASRFSVCVVDDPTLPVEELDGHGVFTAGYEGNDAARIQPARRAAAFWDLWGADHQVARPPSPSLFSAEAGASGSARALWHDATLPWQADEALPEVLAGGVAAEWTTDAIPGESVLDPAGAARALLAPVADRVVRATAIRFAMFGDDVIDTVEVDVDGAAVPILARFVVLAADAGNGDLLQRLASRFPDPDRRRSARAAVRTCQANRRELVVALRGDLPELSGWFGGLRITAHRCHRPGDGDEVVWLVSPPPDDARTTTGPEDLRFEPPVDSDLVGATVERLFALSPEVFRRAHRLRWAAWTARRTQHPMLAVADTAQVGQPVPARLETLGLEGFLALWPSHPAYTMILGDVAAERIAGALGASAEFSEGVRPADLRGFDAREYVDRWDRHDQPWDDWELFAEVHDVKLG